MQECGRSSRAQQSGGYIISYDSGLSDAGNQHLTLAIPDDLDRPHERWRDVVAHGSQGFEFDVQDFRDLVEYVYADYRLHSGRIMARIVYEQEMQYCGYHPAKAAASFHQSDSNN